MTPAQLRAYASVVRNGSVKAAAAELEVSDAAVSMHIAQLRKDLGDQLFSRTGSGLAFTPGGLRLAGRAIEILGLQDRTAREVSQAASGRRLLRLAASSLFAEYAAPGLIELFTSRAKDLDVELNVQQPTQFQNLLAARTIDVAIGPDRGAVQAGLVAKPFLTYTIIVVTSPANPLAGRQVNPTQLSTQDWALGPSAIGIGGVVPELLKRLGVPESRQRIFQSGAAALEEARRTGALSLAVSFSVASDLAAGRLVKLTGRGCEIRGTWRAVTLDTHDSSSPAAELLRFVTTPRATQAMLRGSGVGVSHFRPSVYVTLWS